MSNPSKRTNFPHLQTRVVAELNHHLDQANAPSRLVEAMRYSVLNGGKRIRPVLLYLSAEAMGGDLAKADTPACAIEFAHAYSLIHDDLPAMDDDDVRRGKPSCHIQFDEATAILAGDALQALAYQIVAEDARLPAATRVDMIAGLSHAIGAEGMVAGQIIDLSYENRDVSQRELEQMHHLKTGALISLCVTFGGLIADVDTTTLTILEDFGARLGLAFQIQDDILDAIGHEGETGKPQGSDAAKHKSTYVTTLGLDAARQTLVDLLEEANDNVARLGPGAASLQHLAEFAATRNH